MLGAGVDQDELERLKLVHDETVAWQLAGSVRYADLILPADPGALETVMEHEEQVLAALRESDPDLAYFTAAPMRVNPLRTYDLPDVGDHLIHFTGRNGPRTDDVDQHIRGLSAERRLVGILVDRTIRGFEAFGAGAPVACFSESAKAAIPKLVREGRYAPCGIAFSKQLIFESGGGPALYVRGDEWETMTAAVPQPVRSRLVRFWPGATPPDGTYMPSHLANPSEWLHEREWWVPGEFRFDWPDVKFLVVPDSSWQRFYAEWIEDWAGEEYGRVFAQIPAVVMDSAGRVVRDELGVWA
jgi:hypothetical protein